MFGFSMVQTVRNNADRLDCQLRERCISLYRPFKWTPCFLHRPLEALLKKTKRFSVIIQFKEGDEACKQEDKEMVDGIINRHLRCKMDREFGLVHSCCATVTAAALEEMLATCPRIKKVY